MQKKTLLRSLMRIILPPIGWLVMWVLYLSNKKRWHIDMQQTSLQTPCVILLWHGELLMAPFIYRRIGNNHPIQVMVSDHFDGELIARTIAFFGMDTVRGSSRKGAIKALKGALHAIRTHTNIAITPDGPKGPRHSFSDGAVAIAHKEGVPVYLFHVRPSCYWECNSWDRFIIPKPFGTITFDVSGPIYIHTLPFDEAKATLHKRMVHNAL